MEPPCLAKYLMRVGSVVGRSIQSLLIETKRVPACMPPAGQDGELQRVAGMSVAGSEKGRQRDAGARVGRIAFVSFLQIRVEEGVHAQPARAVAFACQ